MTCISIQGACPDATLVNRKSRHESENGSSHHIEWCRNYEDGGQRGFGGVMRVVVAFEGQTQPLFDRFGITKLA